jgi:Immunity protein 52
MFKITTDFYLPLNETLAFRPHIERLYPIFQKLKAIDSLAKDFLLCRATDEESLMYLVFESDGSLTKAAEAVLETEYKNETIRGADWQNNEEKNYKKWVSGGYQFSNSKYQPNSFDIEYNSTHRFKSTQELLSMLELIAQILRPNVISIRSFESKNVFPDRHGVNWMIYLPKVFTAQQIPEARALVPVMSNDKKPVRLGTIVVSVLDELFSDENPAHVKIAHDIEIRMVDQDLLPTFKQLRERPAWLDK